LQAVLGDYVGSISKDVILQKRQNGSGAATPHVMQLRGRRIAWASEPDEGVRIDSGMLKIVSGGGQLNGRELYGKNETFKQTALVLLVTNPKPRMTPDDNALWERVKLVEFGQRFLANPNPDKPNEHKADTRLKETLEAEAAGILAWLVCGFLDWQADGLNHPPQVALATETYRREEDNLAAWLEECCVMNPNAKTKGGELYANYKAWATANGLRELSSVNFGKKMKKRFSHKVSAGVTYEGVGIAFTENGQK
jgi:putative DNA primase/helicase